MIIFAKDEHYLEILDLFNRCFLGEEQFATFFFENFYKKEDTILYIKDDKIVSMLQMIPYDTNLGKATYIYAACTDKNYRKQHIMENLLQKSFEISKERSHKYSFLIPGEPWLFDFYKKYGYKDTLKIGVFEYFKKFSKTDVKIIENGKSLSDDFKTLYENHIKGEFYIKRNAKNFDDQRKVYDTLEFFKDNKFIGYAFYYKKDDKIIIEEIVSNDLDCSLEEIANYFNVDNFIYKTFGENKILGMIKPLCDDVTKSGFVNLLFN